MKTLLKPLKAIGAPSNENLMEGANTAMDKLVAENKKLKDELLKYKAANVLFTWITETRKRFNITPGAPFKMTIWRTNADKTRESLSGDRLVEVIREAMALYE